MGRLISENGYRPDPEDTKALEKFKTPPETVGELRSLLWFLGYYRSYIRDFSKLLQPVYALLKSEESKKFTSKNKILKMTQQD